VSPVRYELGFYIPKDGILHSHRRENIKFQIALAGRALQRRRNLSPVRYELDSYIPEDDILHSHRRENHKSYTSKRWSCVKMKTAQIDNYGLQNAIKTVISLKSKRSTNCAFLYEEYLTRTEILFQKSHNLIQVSPYKGYIYGVQNQKQLRGY
jgi:hypothetical protein